MAVVVVVVVGPRDEVVVGIKDGEVDVKEDVKDEGEVVDVDVVDVEVMSVVEVVVVEEVFHRD